MVTGWHIFWAFVVIVVASAIAGTVDAWREQRKRNKERE